MHIATQISPLLDFKFKKFPRLRTKSLMRIPVINLSSCRHLETVVEIATVTAAAIAAGIRAIPLKFGTPWKRKEEEVTTKIYRSEVQAVLESNQVQ